MKFWFNMIAANIQDSGWTKMSYQTQYKQQEPSMESEGVCLLVWLKCGALQFDQTWFSKHGLSILEQIEPIDAITYKNSQQMRF